MRFTTLIFIFQVFTGCLKITVNTTRPIYTVPLRRYMTRTVEISRYAHRVHSKLQPEMSSAMQSATTMPRPRGIAATPRMPCSVLVHAKGASKPRQLSCTATGGGGRVDRRDVLLSLGGAAAGGLATTSHGALAQPIQPPDLQDCHPPADLPATAPNVNCCPTYGLPGVIDFKLPPASAPLHVRPAAHLVDKGYLAKYERAVVLMKALPDDDPRSFAQQWRVHCAYCDGAYDQVGLPNLEIQVHNCWLFLPWHR
jgi:polyphenol oxidase